MDVDSTPRSAEFSIGGNPPASLFQTLVSVFIEVDVDDDVFLGYEDIMFLSSIQVLQCRRDVVPTFRREAVFIGVLRRTVLIELVKI